MGEGTKTTCLIISAIIAIIVYMVAFSKGWKPPKTKKEEIIEKALRDNTFYKGRVIGEHAVVSHLTEKESPTPSLDKYIYYDTSIEYEDEKGRTKKLRVYTSSHIPKDPLIYYAKNKPNDVYLDFPYRTALRPDIYEAHRMFGGKYIGSVFGPLCLWFVIYYCIRFLLWLVG